MNLVRSNNASVAHYSGRAANDSYQMFAMFVLRALYYTLKHCLGANAVQINIKLMPTNAQYYFDIVLLKGTLQHVSATNVATFREINKHTIKIKNVLEPLHN